MPVQVTCTTCGIELLAREEDAGREIQCTGCRKWLRVPDPDIEDVDSPPHSPPRAGYRCSVCGQQYPSTDVYDEGDRFICKGCYIRTGDSGPLGVDEWPARAPHRRRSRYEDDDGLREPPYIPTRMAPAILVTLFCC